MSHSFLLLDRHNGWAVPADATHEGVVPVDDGWQLAPDPAAPSEGQVQQPWLARSPGSSGAWWLAGRSGLRRLGPCDDEFAVWAVRRPVQAVVACGDLVVVLLSHGQGRVLVLDAATGHLLGEAHVPGALGLRCPETTGCGGSMVGVVDACRRVVLLDASGLVCGVDAGPASPDHTWPAGTRTWPDGFELPGRGRFDRRGRRPSDAAPPGPDGTASGPPLLRHGVLTTGALDSGLAGCRWHRVRVEADLAPGTSVSLAVATTDAEPGPGVPDPEDWSDFAEGAADVLLPERPGRWAYLRIVLRGDGRVTPVLRRVRLDLPRHGPADHLPEVYSEDPRARDFTERFLGLLGSFVDRVDDTVARRPALLDPGALPDDALGWLAGTLGLGFEPEMTAEQRRALVAAAPDLYRRRGTPGGLRDVLRLVTGLDVVVEEPGRLRPWGALGTARLGGVRLFGSTSARVRLGTARIGGSRLVADGDPDLDAARADAHRVRVHVPGLTHDGRPADLGLVARVARSQSPADVVVTVVPHRPGGAVGLQRAGVDTVLLAPDPAVVGRTGLGRGGGLVAPRAGSRLPVVGTQRVAAAPASPRHLTHCATPSGTE